MPNPSSYTVQSGDTLSRIADRFGTSVDAIARANGIDDPNKIRPGQTLALPGAPESAPSAGGAGGAAVGDDWTALIQKHGDAEAKADFEAGKCVVIGLRTPTNTKVNQGRGRYDDRMIVVRRSNGGIEAKEFPCNTEPSRQYGFGGAKDDTGPDINADGKVDQGRLIAGNYRYEPKPGGFLGGPAFRARSTQTAERDINQDGEFNEADGPKRIDPTGAQRTMYIHRGGDDNTWSAGCQTIPKSRFNAFVNALCGQPSFSYVLVDLGD